MKGGGVVIIALLVSRAKSHVFWSCAQIAYSLQIWKWNFSQSNYRNSEIRIPDFEPEMKSQSDIWKGPSSPRAQKVCCQQLKMKELMTFANNNGGVIT